MQNFLQAKYAERFIHKYIKKTLSAFIAESA